MKVNSTSFLCALPHFRPPAPEEDDSTSLTRAEEEKERLRARKKGWELLRPLEGNCMYFVHPLSPSKANVFVEHRMVDIRILSQSIRKTIPRTATRKYSPSIPTHPRPHNRILHPRPNSLKRTPLRCRIIWPTIKSSRRRTDLRRCHRGTTIPSAENGRRNMV